MCWGAFFASGDDYYVALLIVQLQYMGERQDETRYLGAATAKWSLSSNARQHSRVRLVIDRTLATGAPPWSKELLDAWRRDLSEVLTKEPGQIREEILATAGEHV